MTKILMVSTVNTNIGDDLIRSGVERIMSSMFADTAVVFDVVNKHRPLEIYSKHSWQSAIDVLPRGKRALTRLSSRILSKTRNRPLAPYDFVAMAGTPTTWRGFEQAEWIEPIWRDVLFADRGVPVLNLAMGSSYPWLERDRVMLSPSEEATLVAMLDRSLVRSARDELMSDIASRVGRDVDVLPCAALLWSDGENLQDDDGPVLVNVMPGGGHFDWDQGISPESWLARAKELHSRLSGQSRIVMLCHNQRELDYAATHFPDSQRTLPRTIDEYRAAISGARAGVVNRLHAAVALAGVGIPAVAVGTDTRLLMIELLGLPHRYVDDVTATELVQACDDLTSDAEESARLLDVRAAALERYQRLLVPALP